MPFNAPHVRSHICKQEGEVFPSALLPIPSVQAQLVKFEKLKSEASTLHDSTAALLSQPQPFGYEGFSELLLLNSYVEGHLFVQGLADKGFSLAEWCTTFSLY